MLAQTGAGSGRLPLSWGKATLLGAAWAVVATICNAVLWALWLGPSAVGPSYFLTLLVPPCLLAVIGGVLHRSERVALMTGPIAMALSALGFILLVVVALTSIHVGP